MEQAVSANAQSKLSMHVPLQSFYQLLLVTIDIKDLDGTV
jgi:hypothetical protein